jgi:hypothetical protein
MASEDREGELERTKGRRKGRPELELEQGRGWLLLLPV